MDKTIAKTKFTEYQFLELFMVMFKEITGISIISKDTLEKVLFKLQKKEEYKLLFEDIASLNGLDNERVILRESFTAATICGLLTQIQDARSSRYIIANTTNSMYKEIIDSNDNEYVEAMEKLIKEFYPLYVWEVEYPSFKITEETRQDVIKHPEKYMACPVRVRMGKFYTDEEWKEFVEKVSSAELPGENQKSSRGRK